MDKHNSKANAKYWKEQQSRVTYWKRGKIVRFRGPAQMPKGLYQKRKGESCYAKERLLYSLGVSVAENISVS